MAKQSGTPLSFGSSQSITHSLYKLKVAAFKKNVANDEATPVYVDAEHVHFFHSVSNDGLEQTTSTPIGGHFHRIETVTPATDTTAAVLRCSGPLKWVQNERKQIIAVPFIAPRIDDATGERIPVDSHTHEIEYIRSTVLETPKVNAAAAVAIANIETREAAHTRPLPV